MADHSKPVLTSTYANFVTELDARFDDLAVGLDPAFSAPTNLPNNSIRWSSASNKWEKFNLTVWSPLSTGYDIDIANGSIVNSPISGSTGSFTTLAASGAFSLTGDQVQVSEGGTGATTAATARANLGAAPTASPSFTGPVSIITSGSEGRIFAGTSDGYFFANSGEAGWYSPTLGSFKYNFSTDQLSINGQTAWHQGNDGAGSGLDADLLDGQQGSYYAPTANATLTGVTKAQNITVTDMTLKINPTATNAGYGVIHRNDGVNYYLLLTNLNDALGGYNALRPVSMNCATGEINFDKVTAPTPPPGTNSDRLATTAFVSEAFPKSLAASGWQKLTGGLILQWGSFTTTTSGVTITLPIAFPNAYLVCNPTPITTTNPWADADILSLSQMTIKTWNTAGQVASSGRWFALGY